MTGDHPLRRDEHHLTLCFTARGTINFYPATPEAEELARRLAELVRLFVEYPSMIRAAAGLHAHATSEDDDDA